MKKILIIGAGEIGQAVKSALKESLDVQVWDRDPEKVSGSLEEVAVDAELVFLCVPSFALTSAIESVKRLVSQNAFYISLAKGIEKGSNKFAYQILAENLKEESFGILSGPMLAEEFSKGMGAAGVLASENLEALERVKGIFKNDFISITYSPNVEAVALAAVLKNVYSVAFGIAEAMKWSANSTGLLFSKAVKESIDIADMFGYESREILGTAGIGDMVATSFSPYSLNRENGKLIAQGKEPVFSEGVNSLESLEIILEGKNENLKILNALQEVVKRKASPEKLREAVYAE